MEYVSITYNMRGFKYWTDWPDGLAWENDMEEQAKADNEAEWSILIFIPSGMPVLKYERGLPIYPFHNLNRSR